MRDLSYDLNHTKNLIKEIQKTDEIYNLAAYSNVAVF